MTADLRADDREASREAHEDALARNERDRADEIRRDWLRRSAGDVR